MYKEERKIRLVMSFFIILMLLLGFLYWPEVFEGTTDFWRGVALCCGIVIDILIVLFSSVLFLIAFILKDDEEKFKWQ